MDLPGGYPSADEPPCEMARTRAARAGNREGESVILSATRPIRCLVLAALTLALVGAHQAAAQRPGESASVRQEPVTLLDAAIAFRRIDAQFMERLADRKADPPAGIDADSEQWRRWTLVDPRAMQSLNMDFDRATMAFFGGDLRRVVEAMNAMLVERPGSAREEAFLRFARSIRIEVTPSRPAASDLNTGATMAPTCNVRLSSMYPLDPRVEPPGDFSLVLRHGDHATMFAASVRLDESRMVDELLTFALEAPVAPGAREVLLRSGVPGIDRPGATPRTFEVVGGWAVLPEPISSARDRFAARMERLARDREIGVEPLSHHLLHQRIGLLDLADSTANMTALLTDYAQLILDLEREWAAVAAGVNPYMGREGDCWHGLPLARDLPLPARLYVPASALLKDSMPMVIALHGAGGNENMFVDGYGDGVIRRLAQEHGFAVVSPRASPLMDLELAFDVIVETMKQLYSIDESRIYVIGHSLGAAMTGGMSSARGDRIAAACWLAGAGFSRGGRFPPTLAIGAEVDPLIPPARIEAAVNMAQQAGVAAEYRLIPDVGHTLLVGYVLPDVVEWLLDHSLAPP